MSNAQRKRLARDKALVDRGLMPRSSVPQRKLERRNNVRVASKTEQAAQRETVFSRHGIILPASPGTRLIVPGR